MLGIFASANGAAGGGGGGITLRGSAALSGAPGSGALTLNGAAWSTPPLAGDLIVVLASVYAQGDYDETFENTYAGNMTTPSGYSKNGGVTPGNLNAAPGDHWGYLFTRTATGSIADNATFSDGGFASLVVHAFALTGHTTGVAQAKGVNGTSGAQAALFDTAPTSGDFVLRHYMSGLTSGSGGGSYTPPAGTTERFDTSVGDTFASTVSEISDGTNSRTATPSTTPGVYIAMAVAVR